ncbi:MAG: serine protease [Myxococcaceae bacterium]
MRSPGIPGVWAGALCALIAASAFAQENAPIRAPAPPDSAAPYCQGEYADDFRALAPSVLEYERRPNAESSSYCMRTTAVYECLSYAADGSIRRQRKEVSSHGTAFGYRNQGGETLLLTNEHVAEWPAVTDDDHRVADVPDGCKKVSEQMRIVDNEADAFERDDIPLTKVVSDDRLDIAIVKARGTLHVLPWRIGKSSALKERNVVDVRGFPLGAFRATNQGKVVSAYDHDDEKDWDHDDFVIDALLSHGNSGSPVLAVSCRTGEFELVGIYHAGYTRGSALNVVVGIDQVKELMTTLKKSPRVAKSNEFATGQLLPRDRTHLTQEIGNQAEPFFPFGGLTAMVRARPDGAHIFALFGSSFPLQSTPLLVIEDLPSSTVTEFGDLGRVWFGDVRGLKSYSKPELDADTQAQLAKVLDALRRDALSTFAWRAAARTADSSREKFEHVARLERAIKKTIAAQQELSSAVSDLSDRFGPDQGEPTVRLSEAFMQPWINPAFPAPEWGEQGAAGAP